jgi:sigma-B regulation protein RsbU (phosphoserine phosphatase)
MTRLSAQEPSFRLSDPVDGLRRLDRELLVRRLGIELMVPLRWRNETLGLVLLGEKLTGTEFTSEDVTLLNSLGSQMGVSLQNALLLRDRLRVARIEDELNLAHQIQQTFLQSDFPALPRCEVHAVNLPSRQVGGDYYDVVQAPDGSFLVAIADVAGKGVPAALLVSTVAGTVRAFADGRLTPREVVSQVNRAAVRSSAAGKFVTFFYAELDHANGRLRFVNAGHNHPRLRRADGTLEPLATGGLPLGLFEDAAFEEGERTLGPGDGLLLFSDGISEALDSFEQEYGEDRLEAAWREHGPGPCAAVLDRVYDDVIAFRGAAAQNDDMTMVVVAPTA